MKRWVLCLLTGVSRMNVWKHTLSFLCGTVIGLVAGSIYASLAFPETTSGADYTLFLCTVPLLEVSPPFVGTAVMLIMLCFRLAIMWLRYGSPGGPLTRDAFRPGLCVGAAYGLIAVAVEVLAWKLGMGRRNGGSDRITLSNLFLVNDLLLPVICGEAIYHLVHIRITTRQGFPVIAPEHKMTTKCDEPGR